MSPREVRLISYRALAAVSAQGGDLHDEAGHHRYYGSSACNGGERVSETRGGERPPALRILGL